ncbi:MAG: response regulator [Candidatus Binatus sp.]
MGFEPPEADSIVAALETVRGIGHIVGAAAPAIPGLNSLAPFDACFIDASAAGVGDQPAPIEMIARSRKPAVIIGSFDQIVARFAVATDLNRDFIIRPFKSEDLLLRACRAIRFVETAEVAVQPPARNGTRHVVVADDDATSIVMVSTILKHFNFECDIAHDGEQALDIVRKKRPDLVLLDVSMPGMNGFDALTALRGDAATRSTPVILVSAHRDEGEVVRGFSLGADDYVTKPFNSGELMARINRVLREPEER